jgi:hypothetical protein
MLGIFCVFGVKRRPACRRMSVTRASSDERESKGVREYAIDA